MASNGADEMLHVVDRQLGRVQSGWIVNACMLVYACIACIHLYYIYMHIYGFPILIHVFWHVLASVCSEVLLVSELFLR